MDVPVAVANDPSTFQPSPAFDGAYSQPVNSFRERRSTFDLRAENTFLKEQIASLEADRRSTFRDPELRELIAQLNTENHELREELRRTLRDASRTDQQHVEALTAQLRTLQATHTELSRQLTTTSLALKAAVSHEAHEAAVQALQQKIVQLEREGARVQKPTTEVSTAPSEPPPPHHSPHPESTDATGSSSKLPAVSPAMPAGSTGKTMVAAGSLSGLPADVPCPACTRLGSAEELAALKRACDEAKADAEAAAARERIDAEVAAELKAKAAAAERESRQAEQNLRLSKAYDILREGNIALPVEGTGYAPLHAAAAVGNVAVLRKLMEFGEWLDAPSHEGVRPIALAVEHGHLEAVKFLIDGLSESMPGADLTVQDSKERNLLHFAAHCSSEEVIRVLVEAGVNPLAKDADNHGPWHYASIVSVEAALRYHAEMAVLAMAGLVLPRSALKRKWTALHVACREGHGAAVTALLDMGCNVAAVDEAGTTPVYIAASRGHRGVLVALMESMAGSARGARGVVEVCNQAIAKGFTPLHAAAHYGHLDIVKVLVEQGSADLTTRVGMRTALDLARAAGHVQIVQYLRHMDRKRRGLTEETTDTMETADGSEDDDESGILSSRGIMFPPHRVAAGWTALHCAADADSAAAIAALLRHGENINAIDKQGNTPLHTAACGNREAALAALLGANPRPNINPRNAFRQTPLHQAAGAGHAEAVLALLEAGADVLPLDKTMRTPRDLALQHNHTQLGEVFRSAAIHRMLKDSSIPYNPEDESAGGPLHAAVASGVPASLLQHLASAGSPVGQTDAFGCTALHLAVHNGNVEHVMELLKAGADPNHRSAGGISPLHRAAFLGRSPIVKALVDAGAMESLETDDGDCAADLALTAGFGAIASQLRCFSRAVRASPTVGPALDYSHGLTIVDRNKARHQPVARGVAQLARLRMQAPPVELLSETAETSHLRSADPSARPPASNIRPAAVPAADSQYAPNSPQEEPPAPQEAPSCQPCQGSGKIIKKGPAGRKITSTCTSCGGSGREVTSTVPATPPPQKNATTAAQPAITPTATYGTAAPPVAVAAPVAAPVEALAVASEAAAPAPPPQDTTCTACGGKGKVVKKSALSGASSAALCGACRGTGQAPTQIGAPSTVQTAPAPTGPVPRGAAAPVATVAPGAPAPAPAAGGQCATCSGSGKTTKKSPMTGQTSVITCTACNGSGAGAGPAVAPVAPGAPAPAPAAGGQCATCSGSGKTTKKSPMTGQTSVITCTACNGSGAV